MIFLTFEVQRISNNSYNSLVIWLLKSACCLDNFTRHFFLWFSLRGFIPVHYARCQQEIFKL